MQKQDLIGVGNWVIDQEQKLGGGSYGMVYVCHRDDDENTKFAAKKIPLSGNQKDTQKINTELRIFSKVNNPYVVKMHSFKKTQNSVYIFMDLCNEGSLSEYVKKKSKIPVPQALDFLQKLVNGYQALREQKVIHRDLKPDNILIDNGVPKITDFGLGRIFSDIEEMVTNKTKTLVGSEYYMAPELLQYVIQVYRDGALKERPHYTDKCDVWSMGLVFYYMLAGTRPWDYLKTTLDYLNNIQSKPINIDQSWPLEVAHLLTRMLAIDVNARISWEDVFSHPLVNQAAINQPNLQQQLLTEIQAYINSYPAQFQYKVPALQLAGAANFLQGPGQHVTQAYMPKKVGDSAEMSIEMEDEN